MRKIYLCIIIPPVGGASLLVVGAHMLRHLILN